MSAEVPKFEPKSPETKLPKLHFDLFFAPHSKEKDIMGLNERFKKADIFIPERIGWTQKSLDRIRAVSSGVITPEQAMSTMARTPTDFRIAELNMIYGSNKPIIFIDVDKDNKNEGSDFRLIEFEFRFGQNLPFGYLISKFKEYLKQVSVAENRREDLMISNLESRIKEVLKDRPKLRSKQELNILLCLGSVHTRVFHELLQNGQDVSMLFNQPLTIYTHFDESKRTYKINREISDETAAKALLERFILSLLMRNIKRFSEDTNTSMAFKRKIANQFSFEEIRDIFDQPDEMAACKKTAEYLDGKKINFPKNYEDLINFLN